MIQFFFSSQFYIPLGISFAVYLVIWIVKNVGLKKLSKISMATETHIDDIILNTLNVTRHFFIIAVSLYVGFHTSIFVKDYGKFASKILIILTAIQTVIWGKEAIRCWIEMTIERKNGDPSVKTSLGFLGLLLRFILIALVLLSALNNLGFNVSTFITGLGVGGVAIALATQNILGDLFSSLSIVLDKPFIVGDFVSLGEWAGTIEYVGLKTTRIRSVSGEQIVISNSDLLASKIRNFKRMNERRVLFRLGVTYATKRENLKLAPSLIEKIIKGHKNVRFDRAHFLNYGAYSLDIEVVYYVLSPEYNDYTNVHQAILLEIHEAFEANHLDFAFPTQSLFIEQNQTKVSPA